MSAPQRLARLVIEVAFDASVAVIALFNDMGRYRSKVDDLRELERGTLGRAIADSLDARGLTLVPGYESHDLKHALLGYGMTPEDEVRMQAFMIGNRNYSLPSFLILGFGAALLPEMWPILRADFSSGRRAHPVSTWTIERFAQRDMAELRAWLGDAGGALLPAAGDPDYPARGPGRGDAARGRARETAGQEAPCS